TKSVDTSSGIPDGSSCAPARGLPIHGQALMRIARDDGAAAHSRSPADRTGVMAAFTLAHLSDPHLPPLPAPRLGELIGKRALGYLNWTRNRYRFHRRDVVDVLMSDLQAQVPDHIAITGDLVNLALETEFAPALAWLK